MNVRWLERLAVIKSVPPHIVAITALSSYGAQLFALVMGWPLWGVVLVTAVPWLPILTSELRWTYRHYGWLALFYLLVISQGGHVIEHVVQVFQIHVLGIPPKEARGIFGALDIEWVHFIWNSWVLIAVAILLTRFRRSPLLLLTAVFAAWHELEHVVIMWTYLSTGTAGTPGILSRGGIVGSPFIRPDVHFAYNIIETTPLVGAFVVELRRAYDVWLRRAMPRLDEASLRAATDRAQVRRVTPGEEIVAEGDVADAFFVVTAGQVSVTQKRDAGEVELRRLQAGDFFGEIGLLTASMRTASVRAVGPAELLMLDRRTFQRIVERSEEATEDLGASPRNGCGPPRPSEARQRRRAARVGVIGPLG
jgi:hypothetical protein